MQTENNISALFNPLEIGDLNVPNRVFMAPLTRSRSLSPSHTQTPMHAQYYAQRASAGLIITEATQISAQGQGYAWTPGIFSEEQVESWKPVTDAVHDADGHIFVQLWHVGAISHNVFQPDHKAPVSSSVWTPQGDAFVGDYHPDGPTVQHPEAHALTKDEIQKIIEDYKHAALNAKKAGFDGVEFHAANGYLIDQFIRDSVNKRDDEYGGSLENRLRLLNEIVDALKEVLPASRIGVRLTPLGGVGGSYDSNPEATYVAAAQSLSGKGLAYLHVVRPNSHGNENQDEIEGANNILHRMRDVFDGKFIANGGFEPEEAADWIASNKTDAVTFGRTFIANPDLPARIRAGGPYNTPNDSTFFGGNHVGYTDYPALTQS